MKLAISNIAWTTGEEINIAGQLRGWGADAVEVAPSRIWPDFLKADLAEVRKYRHFWESQGLPIVALQSLLFGKPELTFFGSEEARKDAEKYLVQSIRIAEALGAGVLVFGAPKNRIRGNLPQQKAVEVAVKFFSRIGKTAESAGVTFCIEPNPSAYQCDFVTSSEDGIELVQLVRSPGFGLHLDLAAMHLSNENIAVQLTKLGSQISHFHLSAPNLGRIYEAPSVDYSGAVKSLFKAGYDRYVSIEMRSGNDNLEAVKMALQFARQSFRN